MMEGANGKRGASGHRPRLGDVKAVVVAGIVAGSLATVVEVLLWWAYDVPVWQRLFRDARFAAAIVMGERVLAATPFDWRVMMTATAVHFALSVAYALALAASVRRLGALGAIAVGAAFGLLLYGVNMYGFTSIFPWFSQTRDWITLAAHIVFGASAAVAYKLVSRRSSLAVLRFLRQ